MEPQQIESGQKLPVEWDSQQEETWVCFRFLFLFEIHLQLKIFCRILHLVF